MRRNAAATPEPSDVSCRKATGKTLNQWYSELDAVGGVAKGRRDLVLHVTAAAAKDEWWATTIAVEYEKARGQKEKDGRPKGYAICSTKSVAAPISKVFAAFGDAGVLDKWFGGGTKVTFSEGGSIQNADGDRLTITRIRKDRDLRLTWNAEDVAPGSEVEVSFADKGSGKTGITLNHARIQKRRDADILREGWSGCLSALKSHLEGG